MKRLWYMVTGILCGLLFALVAPPSLHTPFEFDVCFYALCGLAVGLVVDVGMSLRSRMR